MATSDSAAQNVRFNLDAQELEYATGLDWTPIPSSVPTPVTPASYTVITTPSTSSAPTYNASTTTADFALSSADNRVKITAAGTVYLDTGGDQAYITLLVDGVDVAPDAGGFNSMFASTNMIGLPICISTVFAPGDTDSHTYAIALKVVGAGSWSYPSAGSSTLIIEEILS